jgi:hypothetical protein
VPQVAGLGAARTAAASVSEPEQLRPQLVSVDPVPAPLADLTRERRLGRFAGIAAVSAVLATLASLSLVPSSAQYQRLVGAAATAFRLLEFHREIAQQELALVLRLLALALTIATAMYLAWTIRARRPDTTHWVEWLGVMGPLALIASTIVGFFVFQHVVDVFVAGAHTGPRAQSMIDQSVGLQAVRIGELAGHAVFGAWLFVVSWHAMRVGLLTRFLGYWGAAAGLIDIALPVGDTLFIGWLGSVGLIAFGWWPGGRPPAWRAGRAIPWDSPEGLAAATTHRRAPRTQPPPSA